MQELYDHQRRGVEFLKKSGCLFWDCGTGKTRTIIETLKSWRQRDCSLRLLVICPINLIENAWGNDIKKFSDFKYCNLRNGFHEADIYLINFESFISQKKFIEIKMLISKGLWACVIDESSRLKNYKGVTTKRCLSIREKFVRRVAMTATPCPNNPMELWSQVSFAKPGVLPIKFGQFKEKYFCLVRGKQSLETKGLDRMAMARLFKQGWVFDFRPKAKEEMMHAISPVCMWVKKNEVLDLPEQIDVKRIVDMTGEMRVVYKQMLDDYITEIKGANVVAQSALIKSLRLRQITSGFSTSDDGNIVCLDKNPKLEMLDEIIEEIGNEQVIIWTNYTQERQTIKERLGEKSQRLDGFTDKKDKIIQEFTEGNIQYLIADRRSVSHGLTFTNCSHHINYSLDYSSEYHTQGRDRSHRIGQERTCLYFYIMVKDSVDEIMFEVVNGKIDNQEAIRRLMQWKKT